MPGISAVSPPTSAQPGLHAALDDAGDDAFADGDVELAGGEVIQEEQRLGALNDHVVDAHRDQIDAHGVVPLRVDGEAQLGADAVGARYQHRLAVAVQRHLDQRAEAADAPQHLGPHRALHARLDALDQFVAGVDIDPGFAIGHGRSLGHSRILHVSLRPKRPARSAVVFYITTHGTDTLSAAFLSCGCASAFLPCVSQPCQRPAALTRAETVSGDGTGRRPLRRGAHGRLPSRNEDRAGSRHRTSQCR